VLENPARGREGVTVGKVQVQAGRHYIDNEDHIWQDAAAAPASTCFRLQSGRGLAKITATFTPAGQCVEFPSVYLVEAIAITNTPRHGEPEGARDRSPHIHVEAGYTYKVVAGPGSDPVWTGLLRDIGDGHWEDHAGGVWSEEYLIGHAVERRLQPIDNATLAAATAEAEKQRQETGRTMGDPVALTGERKKTHGDWMRQSYVAQELKAVVGSNDGHLEPHQREAVDMIVVKLSRILSGDASFEDHWDDIAGYAHLGKGGHTTE